MIGNAPVRQSAVKSNIALYYEKTTFVQFECCIPLKNVV